MIVCIPLAGEGSRFRDKGYTFPKPLITIRNKPMLQWVVESINMPWATHLFICRDPDATNYRMGEMCAQVTPKSVVHVLSQPTSGAATTVLAGLNTLERTDEELLIANSDQWLSWDVNRFWKVVWGMKAEGAIPVFRSVHPKWSYARLDERSRVVEVAEKRPISQWATCGLYYWKSVQQFITCATQMMRDETKQVNGEWYVAPVYNELIAQGGHVMAYPDVEMWGLGTPEDLEEFKLKVCR